MHLLGVTHSGTFLPRLLVFSSNSVDAGSHVTSHSLQYASCLDWQRGRYEHHKAIPVSLRYARQTNDALESRHACI